LHRNRGPFASSFGLLQAYLWALECVNNIQTVDCQQFKNIAQNRLFSSIRLLGGNIARTEAEKQQMV
jgi:hypothetical protein